MISLFIAVCLSASANIAASSLPVASHGESNLLAAGGGGGGILPCNPNFWDWIRNPASPQSYVRTINSSDAISFTNQRLAPLFPTVTPRNVASNIIGRTPAEIHAKFASVIESNFRNNSSEYIVQSLSDRELSDLAKRYQSVAGTSGTPLLQIFAQQLSAKSLLRAASAFGRAEVKDAVLKYSAPSVRDSFSAQVVMITPMLRQGCDEENTCDEGGPRGGAGGSSGGTGGLPPVAAGAGAWDMTLTEIYLDFRTAPIGSLSVKSALAATSIYTTVAVYGAWEIGTKLGTAINYVIEKYAPELSDAIGGTVYGMMEQLHTAQSEWQIGHWESGIDAVFGYPISNSGNPWGDWSSTAPMGDYYSGGGTCYW